LAFAESQNAKPPQTVQGKSDRAQTNQPAAQPPVTITVTTPQPSPEQLKAEREARQRQEAINARVADANVSIAYWTVWLVVVGGVQVVASILGFTVAFMAARAAKRSADLSERALTETQRAFVQVQKFETGRLTRSDGHVFGFRFIVYWVNFGHTPGMEVRSKTRMYILQPDEEPPIDNTPPDAANLTLGPGVTIHNSIGQITIDTANALQQGTLKVMICTSLTYRDVFADTPLHHTDQCVSVQPIGVDYVRDNTGRWFAFVPYGQSNRAN
jgi:hypothetical protein